MSRYIEFAFQPERNCMRNCRGPEPESLSLNKPDTA